jgi:predicted nucleic acid-binding protein
MDVVVDACSVINLTNVGALQHVLSLQACRLAVGPLVITECHGDAAAQIAGAEADGLLDYVNDDDFPADRYLELLDEHELGEGETECIAVAELEGFTVCCDDRRARHIAKGVLGEGRVIGSLRLLKWCVEEEILTCEQAHGYSVQMRSAGGFLPAMGHEFFCE